VAAAPLPDEFSLIARYFAPLAEGRAGAEGLTDDAAFLTLDPAQELVVTADALVAGVHFLSQDPPALVARKALRVNLSDLAAKGARPLAYFMTAAFPPGVDEAWLAAFCSGLAADQAEYGVALMGGDTTSTPGPLTLSITALGQVPRGRALKRRAAKAGDAVVVSGTLGDAALGLLALRGGLAGLTAAAQEHLIDRYHLPRPRTELGPMLAEAGIAHAAIDVSDGLVADLGHICETSGLGAEVETGRLPLSTAAAAAVDGRPDLMTKVLTGGDDYEILFTVPPAGLDAVADLSRRLDLPLTVIGRMTAGGGVRVVGADGSEIALDSAGYRHF
jgi:thiamine-monophosphate kinase